MAGRSAQAVQGRSYWRTCNCHIQIHVTEYVEPEDFDNCPGWIEGVCRHCGTKHTFTLLKNVDGAEVSSNLKHQRFGYLAD